MAKEQKTLNWTLTAWLSLFFGWLGVDRFMMGQVGIGIVKLITLGGLGVWWIIDLIMILSSHNFKNIKWDFPKNKTVNIIIITVILVIFFALIVMDSDQEGEPEQKAKAMQKGQQVNEVKPAAVEQKTSVVSTSFEDFQILCDSEATSLQKQDLFEKKFKGNYVEWTGKVSYVSEKGSSYTLQVKHCPYTFTSDIVIVMNNNQKDKLLGFTEGDTVTYRAKLTRLGDIRGLSATEGIIIT